MPASPDAKLRAGDLETPPAIYTVAPDGSRNRRLVTLPLAGAWDLFWLTR